MQVLISSGGSIVVSNTEGYDTNVYTLTFTHLDSEVNIVKTNLSEYPERFLEFTISAEDVALLSEGSGLIEIFHASELEAVRTDNYNLIVE